MVPVTGYVYSLLMYNDGEEPIVSVFEREEDANRAKNSKYLSKRYKHRLVECQKIHNGFVDISYREESKWMKS
jgi:hypothetical protein